MSRNKYARTIPQLVLLVIVTLCTACSGDLSESEKLERAREAINSNEPKAALIDLKNLLKENPDHGEARILLGQVHLELGDPASAEKELTHARRLGAQDDAILPPLSNALLYQGKYEEVIALSPTASLSATNQGAMLTTQAKARLALGQSAEASLLMESALPLNPDSADTKTTQAAIVADGDSETARKMLDDILAKHPNHAPAWALLGNLERAASNPQAAESAFSRAIDIEPSGRNYLSRALIRLQLDNIEGAQSDVDEAKALLPTYYEVNFLQGLLHIKTNDLAGAKVSLDAAFEANNQFLPTRIYLAEVNLKLGHLAQAEALAAGYLSENPEFTPASKLYAAILLKTGRYSEAESLAGFAMDRLPNDFQVHSILADALLAQGNRADEIDVLQKMQSLQPENLVVTVRLGAAQLAQGDDKTGLQLLNSALEQDSTLLQAAKELVAYHSKRGEHDKAIQIANKFQEKNTGETGAHNLLGLAHAASDDLDSAKKSFQTAAGLSPGDPVAHMNLATIALRDKNYTDARKNYELVLKQYPDHLQTLLKLSLLDQIENRKEDMLSHLEQAIAKHPQAVSPRILLARYYLLTEDPDKVSVILSELLQKDQNNAAALELMGRAQMAQNDYTQAIFTFEKLVELQPRYIEGQYLLSQAYASTGDSARVMAQLNNTLELAPDHILSRLNLAQVLYKQGEYAEASKHVEILKTLVPENQDILYLEGALAKATGQSDEALLLFNSVFDSVSNSKTVLALAQQEWDMDDREIAISRLEEWLNENPGDINVRLYLAKFYSNLNRTNEANIQYRKILDSADGNLVALNNLAWSMRDSDPEQALKYAERAHEVAGSSRQVADTLAVVLMKNKELKRALRVSDQATSGMTASDGDPSILFHRAQILDALGNRKESADLLKSLLNESGGFPERAEAETLLARLQLE